MRLSRLLAVSIATGLLSGGLFGYPQFVDAGKDNWVLKLKLNAKADDMKAELGLGLTLLGHTTAE